MYAPLHLVQKNNSSFKNPLFFLFLVRKRLFRKKSIGIDEMIHTYLQKGAVLRHAPGRVFCNYSSGSGFVWSLICNMDATF